MPEYCVIMHIYVLRMVRKGWHCLRFSHKDDEFCSSHSLRIGQNVLFCLMIESRVADFQGFLWDYLALTLDKTI